MSVLDEAIAELHTIRQELADEAHKLAAPVERVLEKLGAGLAEAGTVVEAVSPSVAAYPAVGALVRDVNAVVQAADAGDEAAQRAVSKISDVTAQAKAESASAQPDVVESNVEPAGSAAVTPSEPATGDGSEVPSPGETGHVEANDTTPVSGEQ